MTSFSQLSDGFRLPFKLANQNVRTVGDGIVKGHVGFPTNDNSGRHSHSLHFDWPDATEAIRRLPKRCQNVDENFVGVTVCRAHIVNSKNNGLVLLLKTILRH